MESPSSDGFQSRLYRNLSGLGVPALCLRLGVMPRKLARPPNAVSSERQGREERAYALAKRKGSTV